MPLVTSTDMFKKAYGKYSVGEFNVTNMDCFYEIGIKELS